MDLRALPSIWPYVVSFGLLTALSWYSWRRGSVLGARSFAIALLFAALWLAGAVAELMAADVANKVLWLKFQVVFQLPLVTAMTFFVLEYACPRRWLTWRWLILLSVPPLLVLVLVVTNDLHHWFWRGFQFDGALQPLRGPANWIALGYGMALVLISLAAFVSLFLRSPQHRWPVVLMIIGQIAGRVFFALDLDAEQTVLGLDPLVLGFVITYGVYAVALFGFRILDPLPTARRTAIDQMQDGMVVFDTGWQALSLNPAAERLLGVSAAQARGKTWSALLPDCPEGSQCLQSGADPVEIRRRMDAEDRQYTLSLSGLQDHRGLTSGYLLLLRDVTEQHRAQAQLLKHQWAEATLQERELLAQELHDGIVQNLGFLNLQAQAARQYLRSGRGDAALDSLDRLSEVALAMQSDTREVIGDLLTVSQPSEGLCSVIRRAVGRFQDHTGMPVDLELGEDLDAICSSEALPPVAGVQLLRILQEALANVRKHAGTPSQIGVALTADGGQLQMIIVDNGPGFDPAHDSGDKHYGLLVMRQRAERIGGELAVHSTPGQGTRVEVCVPLDGNTGRTT
ncbi:MAG: histidine kinase N-terminal 7TM domain-containing protein [Anaerolineae bacterium]|jgi:PAS domain S-box-containing protein